MKKTYNIIMSIVALALTACQSEDYTVQKSDEYNALHSNLISFSVQQEQTTTRSYASYNSTNRPTTMGVWGYADMTNVTFPAPASMEDGYAATTARTIFANQQVTYNTDKWEYDIDGTTDGNQGKYWEDYATLPPYDFFAYMPQDANATLTKSEQKYTISLPVTVTDVITTNETALLCHTPYHTITAFETIPFQMDQTLTGFNIQFSLGLKMDNVRDVTITSVKLKGAKEMFATAGTVSRVYACTLNNNMVEKWDSVSTTWSSITNPTADQEITICNKDDASNDKTLLLTTSMQQWGSNIFLIPMADFTPTIQVTYDVTLNGTTDGSSNYTAGATTRKTVTSTIELNKTNFKDYDPSVPGRMGTIHSVKIKIVPSYLYVLADSDQATGYIVIE